MAHPGASVKLVLAKAGVYKVKTRFGEDYMRMPDTIGEDNTLTLKGRRGLTLRRRTST